MTALCRPAQYVSRKVLHCPICKTKRRMVVRDAVWYGPTVTCCGCGDSWTDGELQPRPFKRAWRQEEITKAKAAWNAAGPFGKAAYDTWFKEQMGVLA